MTMPEPITVHEVAVETLTDEEGRLGILKLGVTLKCEVQSITAFGTVVGAAGKCGRVKSKDGRTDVLSIS